MRLLLRRLGVGGAVVRRLRVGIGVCEIAIAVGVGVSRCGAVVVSPAQSTPRVTGYPTSLSGLPPGMAPNCYGHFYAYPPLGPVWTRGVSRDFMCMYSAVSLARCGVFEQFVSL